MYARDKQSDDQQPGPSRRVTSPIEQPSGSPESREERSVDLNQPGPSNAKQGSQLFLSDNRQPKSRSSNQEEEERKKTQDRKKHEYQKRSGTSGIAGSFYEINLLTLARLRGSSKMDGFFLATNMAGVGAFDDIVLKYWNSDDEKGILIFLQAKHKTNLEKDKVTIDKFKTQNDNNYYLKKYLLDYLKIKKRFNVESKDPLFRGNFKELDCHFVIYTNTILDEKFNENMIADIDNNILSTKESGKAFEFRVDSEENGDLINMLVDIAKEEQIKSLAKILVKYIVCKKNPKNMMLNEFFQIYHIFLSQNVIEVQKEEKEKSDFCIGKFRDDFLKTGDKDLLLERFRKEIFYEYAKRVVFNQKANDKLGNNKEDIQHLVGQVANLLKSSKQINDVEIIKKLAAARALVLDKERRQLKFAKPSKDSSVKQFIEKFENKIDGLADYLFDIPDELIKERLAEEELKLHVNFGNINPKLHKPEHLAKQVVLLFKNHRSGKVVKISDDMIGHGKILSNGDIKNIAKLIGNLLILDKEKGILKLTDRKDLEENVQEFIEALKSEGLSNEELYTYSFDIKVKNFPRFSLVNEDEARGDVDEFLSKLEIFTGQASNEELEKVIKDEMRSIYELREDEVDINFLKIQDKVRKYWEKEGKSFYLEKDDGFLESDILRTVNLSELFLIGTKKDFPIIMLLFVFLMTFLFLLLILIQMSVVVRCKRAFQHGFRTMS